MFILGVYPKIVNFQFTFENMAPFMEMLQNQICEEVYFFNDYVMCLFVYINGCHMAWIRIHYLALCPELQLNNPFQEKYKIVKRPKFWDKTAVNLGQMSSPPFKNSLDKRVAQKRYRLPTEKYKKKMAKERKGKERKWN